MQTVIQFPLSSVCRHWDIIRAKDDDNTGDEEFCDRRPTHLEQSASCPSNRNALASDVRPTSQEPPVWLTDSASEDYLGRALQICASSSSSTICARCYGWGATSVYRVGAVARSFATAKCLTPERELGYVTTHLDSPSSPYFVADFLQAKCDFTRKNGRFAFWAPFSFWGGSLGATYDVHLRLSRKRDFLLVLIELFARSYGWDSTSENRLKIGVWKGVGQYPSNFHVEGVVPTNHFCTFS